MPQDKDTCKPSSSAAGTLARWAPAVRGLLAQPTGDEDIPWQPVLLEMMTSAEAREYASQPDRAATAKPPAGLDPSLKNIAVHMGGDIHYELTVPKGASRHSKDAKSAARSARSTAFRRSGDSGWPGPGLWSRQAAWVYTSVLMIGPKPASSPFKV